MKILFIGDVVARPGRRVLFASLPRLRTEHDLDLVIVNVENAAGGFGLTRELMEEFFDRGIDVLTSGNHIWDKREILEFIADEPRLLRPQNFPPTVPGRGLVVATAPNGEQVAVLNVLGTVFMHPALDCAFQCVDDTLARVPAEVKIRILDFHAEATSEKVAMGWHLDGKVSAVLGTHTHVPTADERVLPNGTAYISDVGMTGCYNSVIGMRKEQVLARFTTKLPNRFEPAKGPATLCGALLSVDPETGRATAIERISVDER